MCQYCVTQSHIKNIRVPQGKLAYQQEHSTVLWSKTDPRSFREMVDGVPEELVKKAKECSKPAPATSEPLLQLRRRGKHSRRLAWLSRALTAELQCCTQEMVATTGQKKDIRTLPGYGRTVLEILKAQLELELARDTKRCRKSFHHCIERISEINGGPLLNGVGIIARDAEVAKIFVLVFISNVCRSLCHG